MKRDQWEAVLCHWSELKDFLPMIPLLPMIQQEMICQEELLQSRVKCTVRIVSRMLASYFQITLRFLWHQILSYSSFWLSIGIEVILAHRLRCVPAPTSWAQCCSTAQLSGIWWYCECLIREWEDLNPSGLGPAELKIAREDLKIRLPCLCNAHSSPSR